MPLSRVSACFRVVTFLLFLCNGMPSVAATSSDDTRPTQVNKTFLVTLHITMGFGMNSTDYDARRDNAIAAVEQASAYFDPIGMAFEVGDIFYIENYDLDTISDAAEYTELSTTYDQPNRINLFLFSDFDNGFGGCGFTEGDNTSTINAIYVAVGCLNVVTLAHELGHYFGLIHTFGAGGPTDELVVDRTDCATTGDNICDTPADPYVGGGGYITNCAFVYEGTDANGDYYDPIISNLMSYYYEDCDCELSFTHDQLEVIAATYYANQDRW